MDEPQPDTANNWISSLRSTLKGRVIEPDDPGYEEAKTVFYGGEDRRPAAIARDIG